MRQSRFFEQAKLMVRCIPSVAQESCFALKGGTAINLFVRDMPRLSVDIDLSYLPLEPRQTALENISAALARISERIKKSIPGSRVLETKAEGGKRITKIVASLEGSTVKIEPNEVLRGSAFPPRERNLVDVAEKEFQFSARIPVLDLSDLYGGKLCAAIDRQHPRDIYDVKLLLENEGITKEIRHGFIVYMASHDRPLNELIDPTRKDLQKIYETDFVGMTAKPVSLDELIDVRERYITELKNGLTQNERKFLVSLKEGNPQWGLLDVKNIDKLPAIQWKLQNIQKMPKEKHRQQLEQLKRKLEI